MAIQFFQSEVWSATLLSILEKSLVFGGAPCVNRDYEGDISAMGDTVHIVNVAAPKIVDYVKDSDLTVEVLTDAEQQLYISQAKAFAFEIDDIDKRQAAAGGALMTEAAQRAAYGLADQADLYLAGLMAGAAKTSLGVIDTALDDGAIYNQLLVPASVALDEANVPSQGRFIVLAPAAYGKLLLDPRFIKANESGTNALQNGVVGQAAGFTILKSNNLKATNRDVTAVATLSGAKTLTGKAGTFSRGDIGLGVTGTGVGTGAKIVSVSADGAIATVNTNSTASASVKVTLSGGGQLAIAGSSIATSYAEQISKVEAFRPEKRFADALKGLHLYGGAVLRPEALVVANVRTAAAI